MTLKSLQHAIVAFGLACVWAVPAMAAEPKTFENDRVLIRDIYDAAGKPLPITAGRDAFVVDIVGAKVEFVPKGTMLNSPSAKAVVIELKKTLGTLPNNSGFPDAFPRPNVKQVLKNPSGTVWDYTWVDGMPPPTHFHQTAVVPVFLADGELRSESPNGEKAVTPHYNGHWRFQEPGRLHTEHLNKGQARALVIELN